MSAYLDKGSRVGMVCRWRMTMSAVMQGFLFVLFMGSAAMVKAENFKAKYSGAVTTTEIDIDANLEEMARVSTGVGRGTVIGPFVFHEIRESEILELGHPENTCDPGEWELVDVHWTLIMTDQRGENQLFFRLAEDQPSMFCIDPNSPRSGGGSRTHDFDIVGGIGRFEHASGRVTVECSGRALAAGVPGGGPAHGAVSCTMYGSLYF